MPLEPEGSGGGGAKKRRVDEKGAQCQEVAAGPEAAPVDRISTLPDDVRRRILTGLPLKDAIRSAALAQAWRDLWKSRWAEPTSCRDIHLLPGDNPRVVLESLESGPRRRLDRFSFVFDNDKLRQPHLKRFFAYAAECRVEDLHVEVRYCKMGRPVFHLPLSSPLLVHLSLRNVTLFDMYYKGALPFYALESIHLHSVCINVQFSKVMALCPRLHTLDLHGCNCDDILNDAAACTPISLRRITIVECVCFSRKIRLNVVPVPSLCSFRYSGSFVSSVFFLPKDASLTDLYICFSDREPIPQLYHYTFRKALPDDLSGLKALTICSNVLKIASSLFLNRATHPWKNKATPQWTNMNNLQSLRELQLLMLGMDMDNLANIYLFLKACRCPNLERLFVQLPVTSNVPLEDTIEVQEALPEDVLVNLRMVKVMNFNWRRFEVQLVSLLLRKAAFLHKVLLVSPNVLPLHVPGVQDADLFFSKKLWPVDELLSGSLTIQQLNHFIRRSFIQQLNHFIWRSFSMFNFLSQSICDPVDHNI